MRASVAWMLASTTTPVCSRVSARSFENARIWLRSIIAAPAASNDWRGRSTTEILCAEGSEVTWALPWVSNSHARMWVGVSAF